MSAELGIYAVIRLFTTLAGTISALPGGTGVPDVPRVDIHRAGYEISLKDQAGANYGIAISQAPLRVELDMLPAHFINAVIAAEDKRFLSHPGFDVKGTLSAMRDTFMGTTRGGSGIAQQMIKNTMVGPNRSISRKGVEVMLAVRAIDSFGHHEVLRRYLQSSWFGRGRTGVMSAPEIWFGKSWADITVAESATLAAMLKGPARYDPWRNPDLVQARRNAIIDVMLEEGWIAPEEAAAAIAEPVRAIEPQSNIGPDQWVMAQVRRELQQSHIAGSATGVLTIDSQWQAFAQEALRDQIIKLSPIETPKKLDQAEINALKILPADQALPARYRLNLPVGSPYQSFAILDLNEAGALIAGPSGRVENVTITHNHVGWTPAVGEVISGIVDPEGKTVEARMKTAIEGAVVAIDPRTGEIIATIGGVDPNLTWLDRTTSKRSPGSSIKPMLYLAALDMGFTAQSSIQDVETTYYSNGQAWRPRNYDRRFLGTVPLHTALERSLNGATVALASRIGIEAMADIAERAGVYEPGEMRRILPSSLGTSETSLARMVSGFATIVNDATPRKRHILKQVESPDGNIVETDFRIGGGPIASPAAVNDLLGMLRGVATRGTARTALKSSPVMVGAKTGTSQDHKDAWIVSVAPHLALGVWIGRDDNRPLPGTSTGGTLAAPIVTEILKQAHAAGLIDENGYRDERMSSGTPWPPNPHAELPRGKVQQAPAEPESIEPVYQDDLDALLTALSTQGEVDIPPTAPTNWNSGPDNVDRNADLLNMLR